MLPVSTLQSFFCVGCDLLRAKLRAEFQRLCPRSSRTVPATQILLSFLSQSWVTLSMFLIRSTCAKFYALILDFTVCLILTDALVTCSTMFLYITIVLSPTSMPDLTSKFFFFITSTSKQVILILRPPLTFGTSINFNSLSFFEHFRCDRKQKVPIAYGTRRLGAFSLKFVCTTWQKVMETDSRGS